MSHLHNNEISISYDRMYNCICVILIVVGMHTKLMYYLSCYLALYVTQTICNTATEQSLRYMKFSDGKIWISKMCHYAGFSQIRSQGPNNI